jgi:RimJ/RimL family protein N-acetyltransferase
VKQPRPVSLVGEHVRLDPLSESHIPELHEAAQYADIWTWLPTPMPTTLEETTGQVRQALADPSRLAFAVVVDGRAAGSTSYLDIDLAVDGVEIGSTWYTPRLWATAVNPECKLLLLSHAFDALGARRVTLKTDGLNARSRAAISKLGAAYDGTLRHHKLRSNGTVRDSAYYSLLAPEWPAAREGLLARLGRT